MHPSYLEGFPQREKFFFADIEDLEIGWFKHSQLTDLASIEEAKAELNRLVKETQPDFISSTIRYRHSSSPMSILLSVFSTVVIGIWNIMSVSLVRTWDMS
ncbi:hypothetical protein AC626_14555 [Pseudoalteromonas rubra]|uniref:Uncharacterized protein n=1 Tax=Pseudoalteromonas rubra TaxID=43658 RepID=A0A0L0ESF9_9GAMM|nr:hypothetical protein AC626_14555 [Pseudoalteromonas rubra]